MASKITKNGKPASEEQILRLKEFMEKAHENSYPRPTEEEQSTCPNLIAFLAPEVVNDPDHRGEHKPKRVLREPMAMVTFDRGAGRYKWVITDKICRVQIGGWFASLVGFSSEIERQIAAKECWIKELEPTRRKEE